MTSRTVPPHRFVQAADGVQLATYDFGLTGATDAHVEADAHAAADAPVVLAVHGFASSALANWQLTGWTRDLNRAGYRVIALDQRGHGRSDKPHSPAAYTMSTLVADVQTVLDAYLLNEVGYLGYSLGARVGWQAARELSDRITRAVLGGIPDGDPLKRFRITDARAHLEHGTEVGDHLTGAYLTMARSLPGNDLSALVSLVEGMRDGPQPAAENAPAQPLLFATGSEDRIVAASRELADATPNGTFFEIPGRNHFNAPPSRAFREAGIEFFNAGKLAP